jgi:hypothetical protein
MNWADYVTFIPHDDDIDLYMLSPKNKISEIDWHKHGLILTVLGEPVSSATFSLHYSKRFNWQWPFIEFFEPTSNQELELINSCQKGNVSVYPRRNRMISMQLPSLLIANRYLINLYGPNFATEVVVYTPHLKAHEIKNISKQFRYNKSIFDYETGLLIGY